MGILQRIIRVPVVTKTVLKIMKNRAFKPYQISVEEALDKQTEMLNTKFKRLERTDIGKKLGILKGIRIQELPITAYRFYEPFFLHPSQSAFIYDLKDYLRIKTSATAGKEKWIMKPKEEVKKAIMETALQSFFSVFHDGEKINLRYGTIMYVNLAPRPYVSGFMISEAGTSEIAGMMTVVPNLNLSYHEKVRYFILNYDKVDGAVMLASTLISQVMSSIKNPINLKGLLIPDSTIAEIYKDEIANFTGTTPKSSYNSTELLMCSIPSVQHPLGFIFDWRRGLFEFIPSKDKERKFFGMDQVKVGESYRLVFTSFTGEMTRYDTGDSILCVSKGDDIIGTDHPVFKFRSRADKVIALQNFTRISSDELYSALRNIGASFLDFTARVEVEKGLEFLAIYLEETGALGAEKIQKLVHQELCKTDQDYKNLVKFFNYLPLKICLLPKGTFTAYIEEKTATVPKVDRINMRDQEFAKILAIKRRLSNK